LYCKSIDQWTSNASEAYNFRFSVHAMRYAQDHHWPNAEIVYDFGKDRDCIVMPIFATPPDPADMQRQA
jgi:hypothetical protein